MGGDARRERRQFPRRLARRGDGLDADHARDLGGAAHPLRPRPDPFDVRDNIMAGAAYLREMHDRYGNASAMLAAYNAGPGRYDDFVSRGRPLPAETVGYLAQLAPITGTAGAVEVTATTTPDPFAWRRAALFVRTASAASEAVAGHSDGEEAESDLPADPLTSGDVRAADPSVNQPRDTLFVSRARAGRPQ